MYTAQLEDITKKHNCQSHMYADDNQTYVHCRHPDVSAAASKVETCIKEINDWMDSIRLKLNPSKTELVWFSTRQGFNKFTRVTVEVRSATIDPVKYAKSLGVTLDEKLKLSKHVSNVTSSCFYQIRQLKHIRRYLDFQSPAAVVHSFVTSRLDYCNGLLAVAPAKQTDELQSPQRICSRFTAPAPVRL